MSHGRLVVATASLAALTLAPASLGAPAQAASPPNDDVVGAMTVTVPGSIGQSNAGATSSPGDGRHVGGHSIWFTFRASRSTTLLSTTAGSTPDTLLTLFQGPRSDRTLVDWDDNGGPGQSSAERTRVVRGHRYWIAVSTARGPGGHVVLTLGKVADPAYTVDVESATAGTASGRLVLTGTITCATPSEVWLYGGVSERVGDAVARGFTYLEVRRCGGAPTPITLTLDSDTGWAFEAGQGVFVSSAEVWDGITHTGLTFDSGVFPIVEDPLARTTR
ncbi:hypothetical protein [Nocardioides taihuensis]|uniref:Peptidase C-terminal archaeal/bacterial domain-containing protein n=1 Tax=Nocardioides taihuensis TaxID=1835606 RepID=A0ABW0BR74_9ACTN